MAHWIGKEEIETMTDHPRDFQPEGKKCDYCEHFFDDDEVHETIDNEDICTYCIDDYNFVRCEYCGAVFEKEETMTCCDCGHQVGKEEEE